MKEIAPAVTAALACAAVFSASAFADNFSVDQATLDQFAGITAQGAAIGTQSQSAMGLRSMSPTSVAPVAQYLVRGFDVSHHDNDDLPAPDHHMIQWARTKAQGFSFVFIKATESADFKDPGRSIDWKGFGDPDFSINWQGAKAAGLARGAYHFYNFCESGVDRNLLDPQGNPTSFADKQADYFIASIPANDPGELPPTIDLEESWHEGCGKLMPGKAQFQKDLGRFVQKLKDAYGANYRPPILYMGLNIYKLYFQGESIDYPIWFTTPKPSEIPANMNWAFWQYDYFGNIDGVSSGDHVDLDVFSGSPEEFAAWMNPGATVTTATTP